VPFHMWTPDVYEGAPTPVTAFFASAPKVAAIALATRVAIDAMGPAIADWRQIVIFASLASILFGSIAAIRQENIKRLLAYSSIANVGFALVGFGAGGEAGVSSVLYYVAIYVVMTLGSFLVVLQMRDHEGRPVETISSLAGMSRTRPGLAVALAIFMFSLAGIPPLLGFFSKLQVFLAAVHAGLYVFAAVAAAASTIGATAAVSPSGSSPVTTTPNSTAPMPAARSPAISLAVKRFWLGAITGRSACVAISANRARSASFSGWPYSAKRPIEASTMAPGMARIASISAAPLSLSSARIGFSRDCSSCGCTCFR